MSNERDYYDLEKWPLPLLIQAFKENHPSLRDGLGGLNGQQMRKVLMGDLVIVKISGTKKFELWTRERIESGELDHLNERTRAANREIRRRKREREKELLSALGNPQDSELIARLLNTTSGKAA
jgi:hypothetical protein